MKMNGLSLEVIESRCRPTVYNIPGKEGTYRSLDGFLSPEESLLQVIEKDQLEIKNFGLSCRDIVEELQKIIRQSNNLLGDRFATVGINYDKESILKLLSNGVWDIKFENPSTTELLYVTKRFFASPQYSPFYNDSPTCEYPVFNNGWNIEYEIKNSRTDTFIRIGGGIDRGVLPMIEIFGFCEGGCGKNPYRLAPALVVAVLTGIFTPTAVDHLRERLFHEKEEDLQLLSAMMDMVKRGEISEEDCMVIAQTKKIQEYDDKCVLILENFQSRVVKRK